MPTQEQIHDWKYEVANDDTRLGLADWVAAQIEAGAYPDEHPIDTNQLDLSDMTRQQFLSFMSGKGAPE